MSSKISILITNKIPTCKLISKCRFHVIINIFFCLLCFLVVYCVSFGMEKKNNSHLYSDVVQQCDNNINIFNNVEEKKIVITNKNENYVKVHFSYGSEGEHYTLSLPKTQKCKAYNKYVVSDIFAEKIYLLKIYDYNFTHKYLIQYLQENKIKVFYKRNNKYKENKTYLFAIVTITNYDYTDYRICLIYCENANSIEVNNTYNGLFSCSDFTEIEILSCGNEIINMGGMFYNCSNLEKLSLHSLKTNHVIDMSYMFAYCGNLTELDLSSFNTSNVTNMKHMFSLCTNLTNIKFSDNFNTINVTSMSDIFAGCINLSEINISNFDTRNVTDMSWMFYNCSSLTNLDLSNFKTGNVTYMQNMFKRCNSLLNLNLSHFDTSNVEYMFGMFSGCSSLKELNLSSFNTDNVKDMSDMFSVCCKVLNLDLSNFNTTNVKDMNFMFMYCSNLETLYLGEKFSLVAAAKRDNIDFMFKNCFNFYTDTSLLKCFGHVINIIKKYHNTGLPLCKGILNKKIYNNIQYTCNFSMCVFLDHK